MVFKLAEEFAESWTRLGAAELRAIGILCDNSELCELAPEFMRRLKAMLVAENARRDEFRSHKEHAFDFPEMSHLDAFAAHGAALSIRRAAIHSQVFAEWAGLLYDALAEDLAARTLGYGETLARMGIPVT